MKKLLLIPLLLILSAVVYGQALNETPAFDPFAITNMEIYIYNEAAYEVNGTIELSATSNGSGSFFRENYTMPAYSIRPFATFSLTNPVYYVWMKNCTGGNNFVCDVMADYMSFTPQSRMNIYITGSAFQIQFR